jgi:Uma2 family endonuclease
MATTAAGLTFRDLDGWANDDPDDRLEMIDGELVVMPPPTADHQSVSGNTVFAPERHLCPSRLGRAYAAPIGVRFTPDNVVQPDFVVVLAERLHIAGGNSIDGAPNLVVEMLSPSTRVRDLGTKRDLSARFGVQAYGVLDPSTATIRVLALDVDRFEGFPIDGGIGRSRVLPGLAVAVADPFAPA